MEQCAEHVSYQIPNIKTRIKCLSGGVSSNGAPLWATMYILRNDQGPDRAIGNFEDAAPHLFPHDPAVKRKSAGGKRKRIGSSEALSHVEVNSAPVVPNAPIGKTGDYFRR